MVQMFTADEDVGRHHVGILHRDDAHLASIDACECVQCVIEGHEVDGWVDAHDSSLVQRDVLHTAPTLHVVSARMLDQDPAHQLRRDREEMGPVLPLHPVVVHEAHVGFVDQSSGLEAVSLALTSHVAVRKTSELGIDDWRELLERASIAVTPGTEQRTDVVCAMVRA